ncbi:uncharacterized protein LOC119684261 [Teleopsis dalmanni]|uniref:uncharacterized protein LOC119684261 n=1 Tax=Teleopsis dalmanni TaxID=139649 RepID=UPI0018CF57ED|nr:uncharacterized protein LOC119684261 [Teleopsis dalmanni]
MFLYSAPKRIDLQILSNTPYLSYKRGEASLPLGVRFAKNIGSGEAVISAHLNFYCRLADPEFRLQSRTTPIPCIEPLLITHVASNHNLAADCEKVFNFGQAEYLVACQSHHLRNPWRNVWVISNGHWNLNSEENNKIKEIRRRVWDVQIVYR